MTRIAIILLSFSTVFFREDISADPLMIAEGFTSKRLGVHLWHLEDTGGTLTIHDVSSTAPGRPAWTPSRQESLGFGFTASAIWIQFTLGNKTNNDIDLYLEQEYPLVSHIDLYVPSSGAGFRAIKTGHSLKFSERPIEYRNFVFPLTIRAGQRTTCYLRYESIGAINVVLNVLTPEEFDRKKDRQYPLLWMLYGIIMVMILYNTFIFTSTRDLSYLYYLLYLIGFLIIAMTLNGTAFQYLWPDSPRWANYCIPFLIGMLTAVLVHFGRHYTQGHKYLVRLDRINLVFITLCFIAAILSLLTDNYRQSMIIITSLCFGGFLFNYSILIYLAFVRKFKSALYFISAFTLFAVGTFLYIGKDYGFIPEVFITTYGIHFGAVAKIILLSLGLADRMNTMKDEMQQKEQRYRNLVESTSDIIFTLDRDFRFISVNSAMKRHLGYADADVLNKQFLDLIHEDRERRVNLSRRVAEEYITTMKATGEPAVFRTRLKNRFNEPVELNVKLEIPFSSSGDETYLGSASPTTDAAAHPQLVSEEQEYNIGNLFSYADIMSHRLTENLGRFLPYSEISVIKVAIREALVNSIEHGNLNIQFEEKSWAMMDGRYIEFLIKRQMDRRYREKKVHIKYDLTEDSVSYTMTDEGDGFDHRKMIDLYSKKADEEFLLHGRGFMIVKSTFDVVRFNEKGNEITLIKYFKEKPETALLT